MVADLILICGRSFGNSKRNVYFNKQDPEFGREMEIPLGSLFLPVPKNGMKLKKTLNMPVDVSEFCLAQTCGLHIVVHLLLNY